MKFSRWQTLLALTLLVLSFLLYLLHFTIFRDAHHIFIFLVADIAFVPVEVLLVTLIIHRLLDKKEKEALFEKLNMLIGAFYSEVGTDLLKILSRYDPGSAAIKGLVEQGERSETGFALASRTLKKNHHTVTLDEEGLDALRTMLTEKRPFLLRLIENPTLLEHDSFTDLIWAVFHLTEELACRSSLRHLEDIDRRHLMGDAHRVYGLLISEWMDYMSHLKSNYPYLFSLALRMNPFDPNADPQVS